MSDTAATVETYMQKESLSSEDVEQIRKLVYGSEKNRNVIRDILKKLEGDTSVKRSEAKAYKLALAYWFVDRDDEAIKLLGMHLKSKEACVTYVNWCLMKERFSPAYDAAKEGLKKLGAHTELKLLCAQAAVRCGKVGEAEKIARKVKKALSTLDLEVLRARAQEFEEPEAGAASEKDEEGEAEEQHTGPPRHPDHSRLFYLLGLIEEAKGNWEDAIEQFDNAIIADSRNILAYFRKAYNLDLRGIDEEAVETYEAARRLRPLHANILFNLGVLYEDMGRNRKAIQCYKTILEDNPNHKRAGLFLKDAEASRSMVYDEEEEKEQDKLLQVLNTPITDFELSVRSRNCLAKMNIRTLGDLSRKTEVELLSYKNFGETSLAEIKALLSAKGLALGMDNEELLRAGEAEEEDEEIEDTKERPDLLDTPLNTVNFSVRCKRAFEKLGFHTLGDLAQAKEAAFQGLRNFGQTSFNELRGKLAEYGLALANN